MVISGEPDNVGSSGETGANCAYVNGHGDWRDHLCNNTKRFVCKRPAGRIIMVMVRRKRRRTREGREGGQLKVTAHRPQNLHFTDIT